MSEMNGEDAGAGKKWKSPTEKPETGGFLSGHWGHSKEHLGEEQLGLVKLESRLVALLSLSPSF